MSCSECGRENRADARFCDGCGAAQVRSCLECAQVLRPDARFCDACGTAVAGSSASAEAHSEGRSPLDYTPKHLADRILRSKFVIEGERKQVTVLFADVRGSMALAEQLGAEEWHRILEGFFEILSAGVHRFEGTVNQYTGDGIMALFGAPIAHEDHAQRACLSALYLRDALRDYADALRRSSDVSFSTRIGINSGEVVVGKIGDDLRMDYTAQGQTVGLAQRVEQRAAPDSIYVTRYTARLVEGYFTLRGLGAFELKGVSDPIDVYALEGLGEIRTRLERSRARGFSRFVGRDDDLEVLDSGLEAALGGRGGVIGVVAHAGVGKSRLCMEFAERCRSRGVTVYEAHCPSHGKAIPLLPVLELFRGFFGIQDDDDDRAMREKITGRLLVLDREFEPLLPLALDFLGVRDPDVPFEELAPAVRQREVITLVRRMVLARGRREPAVILLDDVHWIDPASDEFLAALAETAPDTQTLLLLNFRPEYSADWMTGSKYLQLPLHPLGDEATAALTTDLLGEDLSVAPLSAIIRERSGGNPFYVEEIVQNLFESGRLQGERGAFSLVGTAEVEVPPTVQAILGARVDRLGEREKRLLQTAAVIGRTFPESLLRRISELDEAEFDESIRALSRAEFIFEHVLYPEIEHRFRHPLTHEVAERSQLGDRRRTVHAQVARALEQIHAEHLDENAALLAHHWDESGDVTPAALWHRRAAEWIAGSQPAEATRHWQRVRTLSEEMSDLDLAAELGERSRLMILEFAWRIGAAESEIDALVSEGEAWATERNDPRALAALYNAYSMPAVLVYRRLDRAAEAVEKGLALVSEFNDPVIQLALEIRAYLLADFRADVAEMRRWIVRLNSYPVEALEAVSPVVGYDANSLVVGYRGNSAGLSGRLTEATRYFAEGLDACSRSGELEVSTWLMCLQSQYFLFAGDTARAVASAQGALTVSEKLQSPLSIGMSAVYLARALVASGEVAQAIELAERGIELSTRVGSISVAFGNAAIAAAELESGRYAAAREAALRGLEWATSLPMQNAMIDSLLLRAEIEVRDPEAAASEAVQYLDRSEQIIEKSGAEVFRPRMEELRARVASGNGDTAAARAQLERARVLYEQMGAPLQALRLDANLRGA